MKCIRVAFALLVLAIVACQVMAQACPAQNWAANSPNVWAADMGEKVMLNNSPKTNRPTIPIWLADGAYSPWGSPSIAQLNPAWSCPSGTPTITMAGARRETISFQVFISANASSSVRNVSVTISPVTGPGTLTSDNTQTSNVTRYLEGYVPYYCPGTGSRTFNCLVASGYMPDPLIPFYDTYDTGNPAVAAQFNVQAGTTQGVWVNISIPATQAAGDYAGTVTVKGNGIATTAIPLKVTVWNGTLPPFDAGSTDPAYADMLKSWLPFSRGHFDVGEGFTCYGANTNCTQEQAGFYKYAIMGHDYDLDVQLDGVTPAIGTVYPAWGAGTSFTVSGPGSASTIDWTAYDEFVGPMLTPGGLFKDGTYMRVFDSPLSTVGGGAWVSGGWKWSEQVGGAPVPPDGLMQLVRDYSTQISQHFSSNHTSKRWGLPELISYTFDETNSYHYKDIFGNPLMYRIVSAYNQAINSSNSALSATWNPSTMPIHNFLTDLPACQELGDNPPYTDPMCADHIDLSYPGGKNATPGYSNSWVNIWSPHPDYFMPGKPGPPLWYGVGTTLTAGTGYQYTLDLTQGVPALSTAPAPIERWFYQGTSPENVGDALSETGVGQRVNYWIAYKYGLDETVASVGDPHPVAPAPGGVWIWIGDFWGGYDGLATPGVCSGKVPSPFVSAPTNGDGVLFYPGNEIGCYYTANPVGKAVLTASPAVNSSCTSNGYSVCNGISGPVASIRMEDMRRGYQDYEYMYLLGKKRGRAAALAIVNSIGANGMTSWNALNWQNVDAPNYITGVEPMVASAAYKGNCTDSTSGAGGLPKGLPNGPTGKGSSGSAYNYQACPGEWTNDPRRWEAARLQLAQALGFAPPGKAPAWAQVSEGPATTRGLQIQMQDLLGLGSRPFPWARVPHPLIFLAIGLGMLLI